MNTNREFKMHGGISGAAVGVRVKFSSGEDRVSRVLDDGTVEISLNASNSSAEQVNSSLIRYLASISAVNPKNIEVVAGEGGNKKLVTFTNVSKEKVQQAITDQLVV